MPRQSGSSRALSSQRFGDCVYVFVAAAGKIDDHNFVGFHLRRDFQRVRDGVGRFESRDNPF
jgi:cell envelope opacity-associated protein A